MVNGTQSQSGHDGGQNPSYPVLSHLATYLIPFSYIPYSCYPLTSFLVTTLKILSDMHKTRSSYAIPLWHKYFPEHFVFNQLWVIYVLITRVISAGVKWLKCKPPSNAKIKNTWSHISTPLHIYMAQYLDKEPGKCQLYLLSLN